MEDDEDQEGIEWADDPEEYEEIEGCVCGNGCMYCLDITWSDFI